MTITAFTDLAAPAKLNLFLHVVGRRADGYHLLQSAFVLIDWCDTLHIERRDDGRLARHDLTAELPADDLCLRAARSLQRASGTSFGADISIDKQVPWGAGMGGGSSDAATTLLALNQLWQLDWPLAKLSAIGLELGADVPFFIGGHNAWVEGIGDRLTPIDVPTQHFAVLKPAASIETRSIFQSPLLERNTATAILAGSIASSVSVDDHSPLTPRAWTSEAMKVRRLPSRSLFEGFGRNDLQPPAESVCEEVRQAAALLEASFGNSRMTGSGSAVFARLSNEASVAVSNDVSNADRQLRWPQVPEGWSARRCRSLAQHPLSGWAPNGAGQSTG